MKTTASIKHTIWQLLLLLLTTLVLPACEEDVTNIKNLDLTPKLVVTSFISPQDSFLVVRLQTTQPAIGKTLSDEQRKVKNASVTISDGNTTVALAYDEGMNRYQTEASNLVLAPGRTYTLKVNTPAGGSAEASCIIPDPANIQITEINFTSLKESNEFQQHDFYRYELNYTWRDAPGVTNYYHALAFMKYKVNIWPEPVDHLSDLYPVQSDANFVRDESAVNNMLHSPTFTLYGNQEGPVPKPYYLHAYLMVTDKHYYMYHKSLMEQQQIDGNPFAEAKFIYSNMVGALGVFGAYYRLEASKEIN
ncbi:DUF4249 domain-containing protein [Pontibacter qinzhouensis]|uniref:DUF4249 domain-containing protein n=1 Tax=Pontibacter qinzhouensis TaxID=2603253 RepID=A0A5C8K8G2_9BACT|nr:DUF4249 domain-containing protein [Pontibacter qinzhouensis]TXK49650.1 DUF4249 domain-containing protein [Pontibacter qinzhouensis]